MTATPNKDRPLAYSTGKPDIDDAIRYWLDRFPPLTASQKATVNAIFERARERKEGARHG
jgi:hypothetical protein